MRRKRIALLLAVAMVFTSAFVGCGQTETEAAKETEAAVEESAAAQVEEEIEEESEAVQEEEPVKIVWAAGQTNAEVDPESDIVKAVEERYNCEFEIWYIDNSNFEEEMNVRLAAGEIPDVIRLKNKENLPSYVNQGLLGEVPIELFEENCPGYMEMLEQYDLYDQGFLYCTYNNTNYGFSFPAIRNVYPETIIWRVDWLKNVGIDKIPTTLEEFETAMYKFTYEDPDGNGIDDTYGFSDHMIGPIFGAFGSIATSSLANVGFIWEDDGTNLSISAMNENTREGLAYLQKLYEMGVMDPEFITGENHGGYWATSDTFVNGRVGVTGKVMFDHWYPADPEKGTAGGSCYQSFAEANPGLVWGEDVDYGYPIVGPDGESGTCQWPVIGETVVLSAECVKDQRKMDVILQMIEDLITDEEYARLVTSGIEGTDWEYDEFGEVRSITSHADSMSSRGAGVLNFCSVPPNFGEKWNANTYEKYNKPYSSTFYPVIYTPSTDEVAQYSAGLYTIIADYFTKIITGEYSIDKFDDYLAEMNANGAKELVDSVNEVYKTLR